MFGGAEICWSEEKNELLKNIRGFGFEDIRCAIENGNVLLVIDNPNYDNQQIFILGMDGYTYCVPFVKDGNKIFLKTAYKSRKFKYLLEKND